MEHSNPPSASSDAKPDPAKWILIVDDELAVRQMIEALLDSEEWSVKVASGAAAAMATLGAAATPPSLLICDIMMPGIDGLQLTRRILARHPALKVILLSGHVRDHSWWPTDLRETCFLTKPFSADQLLAAVREAIAGSGDAR